MEDLSEKEQLEKFREWWKENGNFVIGGVVLGIAIMVGVSQWRASTESNQVAASSSFEALMTEVGEGDVEAAETIAAGMGDEHEDSVYTAQARLALARLYMDSGRDEDAAMALRAVAESGSAPEMQQVALLRLAKVLLYQNKPQEVVDLLDGSTDSAFAARFSETLGDAYVALGRHEDAADAYAVALSDEARMPTVDTALVRWKVIDLPESAATDTTSQAASPDDSADDAGETDPEDAE